MKTVIITIVATLMTFIITIIGALAATGNLNAEAINRLMGRESTGEAGMDAEDPSGPFMNALKAKEQKLDEQEQNLNERDDRLLQRQRILDETLEEIALIQEQIQAGLDELDTDRDERIVTTAKLIAAMNATNAAKDLEAMPPEDAAELLRNIKERSAGRILDAMDPRKRTLVHQYLQERKY